MSRTFSSPVLQGSRRTSKFARSRSLFGLIRPHAGTDWAPRKPGDPDPVFAVTSGTVIAAGVGVLAGHSGLIVVINHGLLTDHTGSDYTITNYGHLKSISVRVGDVVQAGDEVGLMGATGNVTGVHLHFGVRFNGLYSDPEAWLKNKGITAGVTPPVMPELIITPAGSTTPSKVTVSNTVHASNGRAIQTYLQKMGYDIVVDGIIGPKTVTTIKMYQGSQMAPYRLIADGVWGPATRAHYIWTKNLQNTMNKWKGSNLKVDGHYGANTVNRIRDIQRRNLGGKYKGAVDGVPGRVFCRMLDLPTHP